MPNPITITATETINYTLVDIAIEGGTCEPADLKSLAIPIARGNKGVILNGRAPIWVFGTLIHHFHATQWVATNDPRQGGAIVVESHKLGVSVGDIIPLA
jgi:CRISPR-associated protein Csx3